MAQHSFYWHDYETFGLDPQRDRAVQFAGIRTDFEFNRIAKPLVVYCKPMADNLPQPEACYLTGITPQLAAEKGVSEAVFIRLIHEQMAQPNTCSLGYNNLRFDDEVTRNLLYRNFYDPYAREWQAGNSRWDLVDLVRTMYALRPEGMCWPQDEQANVSLRLEKLTAANGISHADAHDALADVEATIALAKLVKQVQPKLVDFFWQNRGKHDVKLLLNLGAYEPVVHVSGMYGAEKKSVAVVLPLCEHPSNKNAVLVYDLSVNPDAMLGLSAEDIRMRVFTAQEKLAAQGMERIALKSVHINKCPIIAPVKVLRKQDLLRLQLDLETCYKHVAALKNATHLNTVLAEVFAEPKWPVESDPDLMLYSGGFWDVHDKKILNQIQTSTPQALARFSCQAHDARLPEMLFRYRARNFPETLNAEESKRWQSFCRTRLSDEKNGYLSFKAYRQKLSDLAAKPAANILLINALREYGEDLQKNIMT